MDKSDASKAAIDKTNGSRVVPITVRQVKYLNNIVGAGPSCDQARD
jgi:putative transposase